MSSVLTGNIERPTLRAEPDFQNWSCDQIRKLIFQGVCYVNIRIIFGMSGFGGDLSRELM